MVTSSANRTLLWLGAAALLAATGRPRARRAAGRGVIAIGITSSAVNLLLKSAARRSRPAPFPFMLERRRLPRRPSSFSFPSGHTASAFAFATAAGRELPVLGVPLWGLAGAVGYSRVYFRVHYPSDVLAGALLGVAVGAAVGRVLAAPAEPEGNSHPAGPGGTGIREVVLVTNARSGTAERLDQARRVMLTSGLRIIREIPVGDLSSLSRELLAHPGLAVIAAGGDGTVGAVADHLVGTDAPMGVIPLGTSNDFARSLGIPADPCRAASVLSTGDVSVVDLGRLTLAGQAPRHFAHAATVGLNVSFAKVATRSSLRRRLGRLSYAVAAATALRSAESFTCEVGHPGGKERLELRQLSIVNAPVFGGALRMRVPGVRLDDRQLDVIAVQTLAPHRIVLSAVAGALGWNRPVGGFRTFRVPRLHVCTDDPQEVCLDGEVVGRLPGDFNVAAEALRVIAPADAGDVPPSSPHLWLRWGLAALRRQVRAEGNQHARNPGAG